jgi:hypothetical protein
MLVKSSKILILFYFLMMVIFPIQNLGVDSSIVLRNDLLNEKHSFESSSNAFEDDEIKMISKRRNILPNETKRKKTKLSDRERFRDMIRIILG